MQLPFSLKKSSIPSPLSKQQVIEAKPLHVSIKTIVISAWLGNTIEFYDFLVYGLAAALFFGPLFFPSTLPIGIRTLASFAMFGVGFIARPLGATLFGYLGDTLGRKKALACTLLGMGVCTTLIGLLPTYRQMGLWAPISLTMLRFLQGLMVGGEWSGAMLLVIEEAATRYRGMLSAIAQTGGFAGQLLATMAFTLVTLLPHEDQINWGWRLPFLFSALLVGVSMWIRRQVVETLIFKTHVLHTPSRINPFIQVWQTSWLSIVRIMLMRVESVLFFLATVFSVSYATTHLQVSKQSLLSVIILVCVIAFPMHILFGALSDKFGRRPIYLFASFFSMGFVFPFFFLLQTNNLLLISIAYILLINIGHNAMNAVQPAFFTELFGPKIRYSGASIGAQLGAMFAGGFTPFIAQMLSLSFNCHWAPIAVYTVLMALVTTFATYFSPETFRRDLTLD
jgi:MFS transporter, MHS family, shikimate and dehydroshikimate transport protein